MGKIRIRDLAKKMGVPEQDLLFKLKSIGVRVDEEDAQIDTSVIQAILEGKRLPQPREVILRDEEAKASAPAATPRRRRPPQRHLPPNPLRPVSAAHDHSKGRTQDQDDPDQRAGNTGDLLLRGSTGMRRLQERTPDCNRSPTDTSRRREDDRLQRRLLQHRQEELQALRRIRSSRLRLPTPPRERLPLNRIAVVGVGVVPNGVKQEAEDPRTSSFVQGLPLRKARLPCPRG